MYLITIKNQLHKEINSMIRKPVILCVDDEKDVLDNLFNLLLSEFKNQFDIELAETGEEALEIVEETYQDNCEIPLIISDYIMPGIKGDELLIKLEKEHPDMIKILLTGQATLEGVRNAYENANLYRYLPKPWEKSDFIITIKEALKSFYKARQLATAEKQYQRIFENAVEGIFQTTLEGKILVVNPALAHILGYETPEEGLLMINNVEQVYANLSDRNFLIEQMKTKGGIVEAVTTFQKKDGNTIFVELFAGPIFDDYGKIEKIEGFVRDITEKKKAQDELEEYQKHLEQLVKERTSELDTALEDQKKLYNELVIAGKKIQDNITYARRIQISILPELKQIKKYIPNIFVIWNPRDNVGGDFYWFKETKAGCLLAIADCTGHGVSGAFMTMIAYSELNRITEEVCNDNPSVILQELCKGIKRTLNKEKKEHYADDGLDIGLCYLPAQESSFIYAGSWISLLIMEDNKIRRIRGDKQSIGYTSSKDNFIYTNHKVPFSDQSFFYLTTDGYVDQLGGQRRKSFGYNRLTTLLETIHTKTPDQQKEILAQNLLGYIGSEYDQVDDVTLIGFKP